MLGLGSTSIYGPTIESAPSTFSEEERYDYDDQETDENDEGGISIGRLRVEQGFSFRSFIDHINAKTKALAMARELDTKRGTLHNDVTMSAGSIDSENSTSTDATNEKTNGSNRRIPSGARARTHTSVSEPNLRVSTPVKGVRANNGNVAESQNNTISDLLIQSTPLISDKNNTSLRNQQPKDLLRGKLIENCNVQNGDTDETRLSHHADQHLESEIQMLRKELKRHENILTDKQREVDRLNAVLVERDEELANVKDARDQEKHNFTMLNKDFESLKTVTSANEREKNEEIFQVVNENEDLKAKLQENSAGKQEITKLESLVAKNRLQIEALQKEARDRLAEHELKLDEASSALSDSRDSVRVLQEQVAALRSENANKDNIIEKLSADISSKEETSKEISRSRDALKDRTSELEQQLDKTSKLLSDLTSQKHYSEQENLLLSEQLGKRSELIDSLEEEIRSMSETYKALKGQSDNEREKLTSKLTVAQLQISNLESQIKHNQTEHSEVLSRSELLEAQKTGLESLRCGLQETNEHLQNIVENLAQNSKKQLEAVNRLGLETHDRWEKDTKTFDDMRCEATEKQKELVVVTEKLQVAESHLRHAKQAQSDLESYLKQVKLFGINLGESIWELFTTKNYESGLDSIFMVNFPDLVAFRSADEVKQSDAIRELRSANVIEINNFKSIIEEKLKPRIAELETSNSELKAQYEQAQEAVLAKAAEAKDLQSRVLSLMSDKEADIQYRTTLSKEVEECRTRILANKEEHSIKLVEITKTLSGEVNSLSDEIKTKNAELLNKQIELDEQIGVCKELEEKLVLANQNLDRTLGDQSKVIDFKMASRTRPHLSRKLYDSLMLDAVNDLNLVEVQNILKNIIILLETPLSKLTKKMPLVSIYLRYERTICLHFANKLHFLIFNETINIKRYTNIAYAQYNEDHDICHIQHPLEACLEDLYAELCSRLSISSHTI